MKHRYSTVIKQFNNSLITVQHGGGQKQKHSHEVILNVPVINALEVTWDKNDLLNTKCLNK